MAIKKRSGKPTVECGRIEFGGVAVATANTKKEACEWALQGAKWAAEQWIEQQVCTRECPNKSGKFTTSLSTAKRAAHYEEHPGVRVFFGDPKMKMWDGNTVPPWVVPPKHPRIYSCWIKWEAFVECRK